MADSDGWIQAGGRRARRRRRRRSMDAAEGAASSPLEEASTHDKTTGKEAALAVADAGAKKGGSPPGAGAGTGEATPKAPTGVAEAKHADEEGASVPHAPGRIVLHCVAGGKSTAVDCNLRQPWAHKIQKCVESVFNIPPDHQVGFLDGKEIDKTLSLASQGVAHLSTLVVIRDSLQGKEEEIASVEDCDDMFKEFYRKWYDSDVDVVRKALADAMVQIKKSKSHRVNAAAGSGLTHMFWLTRRYAHDESIQRDALRFLAESALHDDVEVRAFEYGGIQLAMEIGNQKGVSLSTRTHAMRMFFNLTYQKPTRVDIVRYGGLEHIVRVALDTPEDLNSGDGKKMILSAAKALVMLNNVEELRSKVLDTPRMEACLVKFATHPDDQVRLRAAKVIKALACDSTMLPRLRRWGDVCAALYAMGEDSNSFVRDAINALSA